MKKIRNSSRGVSGKFVAQELEDFVVGMDHHKSTWAIAVYSLWRDAIVMEWVQPACMKTLVRRLGELSPGRVLQAVHEAGPTGYGAARALRRAGIDCDTVSAAHVPLAPGDDQKCDRLDARRLAQCAARAELRVVSIPDEEEEGWREITRFRLRVAHQRAKAKQSIRSLLLRHSLPEPPGLGHWSGQAVAELKNMKIDNADVRWELDMLLRELQEAIARLREIEKRIRENSQTHALQEKVAHLQTIPGVGILTAMVIATELYDPARFQGTEQVSRWLGLAPLVRSSGKTRREVGRSRGGNRRLRTILVEASWRWIRNDDQARQLYLHYCKNTGSRKKAITAMARRLGIISWKMLINSQDYQGLATAIHPPAQAA